VHATVFTSTRGYVDRDEVILSWVRLPEAFVLREGNKCCLPRNGLLSGAVSTKEYNSHGECSHPKGKWPKKQLR